MAMEMLPSLEDKMRGSPKAKQMANVMMIANKPERNTAGSISSDFPHLSAIVKIENPNADPSAARDPPTAPYDVCPETIIAMAVTATIIAIHVADLTCSCKKIFPRTAVMNGAAAKSNSALATGITWIE
jgi:hypothetical protein